MYFLLILFFASLLSITFMIGRKLYMLQNGHIVERAEPVFETQYLENLKQETVKNIKKHGYAGLVATIRLYVVTTNFLKNKFQEAKLKIKSLYLKRSNTGAEDEREISKFLKIISEYKHKIRKIKHQIKEEENL